MKIKILYGIAAGIVVLSLLAFAASGPDSFDDCILENMKDAQTTNAALLIRRSCRAKFPEEILSSEEWARTHPGENYFNQFD